MSTQVGLVGVGEMGMAMLERMRAADIPVMVFARRPEVAATAAGLGATLAGSGHELAAASDLVIVCVYTDDQVREVCLGPDGLVGAMRSGSVLLNHTTGSPDTPVALAADAAPRGVRVLDAALSGAPSDIRAGDLTLLVGGDPAVLAEVRAVLASYSDPILSVGALGDGQRVKLLNNALFGAQVGLAADAERVAVAMGLDPQLALAAVTHCSGDSRVLRIANALGSPAVMRQQAARFIRKDVDMVLRTAAEQGYDLGWLGTAARHGPGPETG